MKIEEAQEAIRWEVEANIPLRLDEVYFDWEIIRPPNKKIDHLDVLMSAVPRELIDSYVSLFRGVGLKPFSFEPESVALSRSMVKRGLLKEPMMIVDLGQTHTSFVIYAGYGLRFASSLKISGDGMTEVIARTLKLSKRDAERLKKEVGLGRDRDERVFEALVPTMTAIRDQISEYIKFYEGHSEHVHDGNRVTKIILSGGGAHLKGIEEYLSSSLKISVEKANPWINIFGPTTQEIPELEYKESLRFATVLGLALME